MATQYRAIEESERNADRNLRALREAIERRAKRRDDQQHQDQETGEDAR